MKKLNYDVIEISKKFLKILVEEKVIKKDFETIQEILENEYARYGIIREDTQKDFLKDIVL